MNVIVTKAISENLYYMRDFCNANGLADYLLGWERSPTSGVTIMVFKMPEEVREQKYRLFD